MMMWSPAAFCSTRACEKSPIKYECTDDLFEVVRIFETDCPRATCVDIASEIDQETRMMIEYVYEYIEEIAFSDTTEFE